MKILFVCKSNVGRSQMACALFNKYSKRHRALSAGVNVKEENREGLALPPWLVSTMAKDNSDISRNRIKQLTSAMIRHTDRTVVLMTKKERTHLPNYIKNSKKVVFWNVADMRDVSSRLRIRGKNHIKKLVKKLVKETG